MNNVICIRCRMNITTSRTNEIQHMICNQLAVNRINEVRR